MNEKEVWALIVAKGIRKAILERLGFFFANLLGSRKMFFLVLSKFELYFLLWAIMVYPNIVTWQLIGLIFWKDLVLLTFFQFLQWEKVKLSASANVGHE